MRVSNSTTFYAQTMPGLETIAWREIQAADPSARLVGFRRYRDKNGLVIFEYHIDPMTLLDLRTTEDIFFLTDCTRITARGKPGLRLCSAILEQSRYFDVGLQIHRRLRRSHRRGRTRFRVISRLQGRNQPFRRVDMQRSVERGILRRYNHKWRLAEDDGDLEVWAALLGSDFICGIRLSDRTMRHRDYKDSHRVASLRPSVAAAMVLLANPQPSDVFVDPMCGSGTILLERILVGQYQKVFGGDIDADSVALCRANINLLMPHIDIKQWNATTLPLEDHSVSKIVTNLPFGKQIGSHRQNILVYPRIFSELERVTRPGGSMVVLTGERSLTDQVLSCHNTLVIRETLDILLLGYAARIYVIHKR